MELDRGQFDLRKLSRAIEAERSDRDLTWAQLSREAGVSVSTIRRFATADDAEADGVIALIGWIGVAPEQFVVGSAVVGLQLPAALDGVIRVDMGKVVAVEASPGRRRMSHRTTIQRLVAAAQGSGVPVATLTKRSAI